MLISGRLRRFATPESSYVFAKNVQRNHEWTVSNLLGVNALDVVLTFFRGLGKGHHAVTKGASQ
jgi:hypothetical protein